MSFTSRSVIWGICLLILAVASASRITDSRWLRSNVFDLLPASQNDALTALAIERAEQELSARLIFLVGHQDRSVARTAADTLAAGLDLNALIDQVSARTSDERVSEITSFYFRFRRQLLTDRQVSEIGNENGASLEQAALAAIYNPLTTAGSLILTDPFGLFPESIQQLQPAGTNLVFDDGYLWTMDEERAYVFVSARTVSATLGMDSQRRLVAEIDNLMEEAVGHDPGVRVLRTGFLFYANAGAESARSEISIIGTGSVAGILILLLSLFRSFRPVALGLLTIGIGCFVAISATLWVFQSVHLFTLVFGASLIGVSIDYTFHYLADEFLGDSNWTPESSIHRILPGITLGLITSIIAYLALTVAPFPGLRQLAVFSSAGLLGAYLTLLCCAGWFQTHSPMTNRPLLLRLSTAYLDLWRRTTVFWRVIVGVAFAVISFAGLLMADVNDDVAILQSQPADLKQEEAAIASLLGAIPDNTFLLVRAASTEALLQSEEGVRAVLDDLIAAGALRDYLAVSRNVPSASRQQRSIDAYATLVRARLTEFFSVLGVRDEDTRNTLTELTGPAEPLSVRAWLDHPSSEGLRGLWIGTFERSTASIVLLEGLVDAAAMRGALAGFDGVTIVDATGELSALLGAYRNRITWILLAGYAAILLLLATRYGVARAAVLLVPPVLAGLAALGAGTALDLPLNLFNLLALILVLGIGIDFTLFIAEARGTLESTVFAIALSAITTILSFGLLTLSTTLAVQSFGLTVLIGIACSFLLAPMALPVRRPADRIA